MIIVNRFQPLTITTKRSILDVAAALDPPVVISLFHFQIAAYFKIAIILNISSNCRQLSTIKLFENNTDFGTSIMLCYCDEHYDIF